MSSTSPTARTLAYLRSEGWGCAVVEHWNPHSRTRADLWGADVIAVHRDRGILLVQCTTGSHHADRRTKALRVPELRGWLEAGGRFAVLSWSKTGRPAAWTPRLDELTLADLAAPPPMPVHLIAMPDRTVVLRIRPLRGVTLDEALAKHPPPSPRPHLVEDP